MMKEDVKAIKNVFSVLVVLVKLFAISVQSADLNVLDIFTGGGSRALSDVPAAYRWFLFQVFFFRSAHLPWARTAPWATEEDLHLFQSPSFSLRKEPVEED